MSRAINHSKVDRRKRVVGTQFADGYAAEHSRAVSASRRKPLTRAELAEQLAAAMRATAEMGRGRGK
jgi:hypothetical protein